jgi:biotin-(acetyl-CoA carboxylase) ligase
MMTAAAAGAAAGALYQLCFCPGQVEGRGRLSSRHFSLALELLLLLLLQKALSAAQQRMPHLGLVVLEPA